MFAFQTLLSKIQLAKPTDFGDLFNDSIVLFKKVWFQGLLLQLLSILIMMPFIISFYIPYFRLALENYVGSLNQILGLLSVSLTNSNT